MRKKIIAVLTVAVGLALLCYPWVSNWLYENSAESLVNVYEKTVEETDTEELEAMLEEARSYNRQLLDSHVELKDPFIAAEDGQLSLEYDAVLDLNGDGMMCSVEIPKIDVSLPVYHGTSSEVLAHGAGHLEGSSFPVGGESTHAVISAHTGMNSAKMFTDLTEMETGDLFFIHILDETLAYRVCDIQVILPEETEKLMIQDGRDLVTLLTCTPYGQNTHRLLVTGERTEYTEAVADEAKQQKPENTSQWMDAYRKALIAGICAVAVATVAVKAAKERQRKKKYGPWLKGGKR